MLKSFWYWIKSLFVSPGFPKVPDQDRALQIVWYGVYRMTTPPPFIRWELSVGNGTTPGQCLSNTCHEGRGFWDGSRCYAGYYEPNGDYIRCAMAPTQRISATAFSHELRHAYIARIYGPEFSKKVGHDSKIFDPDNMVLKADRELFKAGL